VSEPANATGADREEGLESGPRADAASLRAVDRMAGLGALVAGVAHEINNPITYVLGNLGELTRMVEAVRETLSICRAELVLALGPSGADAALARAQEKLEQAGGLELMGELVGECMEGSIRIRDTVREVLSCARPQDGARASLDVHELLDFDLRMLKVELARHATLQREYAATLRIYGQRASIGQVLLNLIRNAVQACTPGDSARHRIAIRTRDRDGGVQVEVADSGHGIPAHVQARLFEPFFTTKPTGTGLGLHISRRIVLDHGGRLEFECPAGGGTIFRVWLPAQRP
jgi:two-component system, NtrC family, sensor kinase